MSVIDKILVPVLKKTNIGSAIQMWLSKSKYAEMGYDGTQLRFRVDGKILNIKLKQDGLYLEDKKLIEAVDVLDQTSPSVNNLATEYAIVNYLLGIGGSPASTIRVGSTSTAESGTFDVYFKDPDGNLNPMPSDAFIVLPWSPTGKGVGVNSQTKDKFNVSVSSSTLINYIAIMKI